MNLTASVDDTEYEKISNWAEARGKSRSQVLRDAISLMLMVVDDDAPDVDKIISTMVDMNPKFESASHIKKEVDDELSLRSRECATALNQLSRLDISFVNSCILNAAVKGPVLTFMRNATVFRQSKIGVLETDDGVIPVVIYPRKGNEVKPDLNGQIHCKLKVE